MDYQELLKIVNEKLIWGARFLAQNLVKKFVSWIVYDLLQAEVNPVSEWVVLLVSVGIILFVVWRLVGLVGKIFGLRRKCRGRRL